MKRRALLFEVILAMLLVAIFSFFSLSYPVKGMKKHMRTLRSLEMKELAQESLPEIVQALSQIEYKAITKEPMQFALPKSAGVSRKIHIQESKCDERIDPQTSKRCKDVLVTLETTYGKTSEETTYNLIVYEKEKPIHTY